MRLARKIYFIFIFNFLIAIKLTISSIVMQKRWAFLNITTLVSNSNSINNNNNQIKNNNFLFTDSALYSVNSPSFLVEGQLIDVMSIDYFPNIDTFNTENNSINSYGCSKYINKNLPEKYIALVSRGQCTFEKKVQIGVESKASAVLVYNNELDVVTMYIKNDSIPSVMVTDSVGKLLLRLLKYSTINAVIKAGPIEVIENNSLPSKSSIYFVAFAFLTVIMVTFVWLTVYYVQKFRYINTKKRLNSRLKKATLKALSKMTVRKISNGDKELTESCPICLENYQVNDQVRDLPCGHYFHQNDVDIWLIEHRNCPMCKINILQACGIEFNRSGSVFQRYTNLFRFRTSNFQNMSNVNVASESTETVQSTNFSTTLPSTSNPVLNQNNSSAQQNNNLTNDLYLYEKSDDSIKTVNESAQSQTHKLVTFSAIKRENTVAKSKNVANTTTTTTAPSKPDNTSQREPKNDSEFKDVPL